VLTGPLPSNGCRIVGHVGLHGNVFIESLPSNRYTRQDICIRKIFRLCSGVMHIHKKQKFRVNIFPELSSTNKVVLYNGGQEMKQ
jgi:hypothetical protein